MPGGTPLYVGIDLGTTNSAVATFDGEVCALARNSSGGSLTPSVVRIDSRGNVTVGARARRFLETDPANTRAEFKRLMGTAGALSFAASATARTPEELSAEILRSLRSDVREATGIDPERAVIAVPAMFELPQSRATAEAARLAGFESVELIQEPVASALAAGCPTVNPAGAWLVYDLGGGTFDASLLEARDGLLRVVAHDGDNFLGGRDFDTALLDWVLGELSRRNGVTLERKDPAVAAAARSLKLAVEDARIDLTRVERATIATSSPLVVSGREIEVDIAIDRATVEALCAPIVRRSIEVCTRLLSDNGFEPGRIERVVLVGGPTVMPLVRQMLREHLAASLADGEDPMTLVARGAALFAATFGLDARPKTEPVPPAAGAFPVWIHAPTVTADLQPYLLGRLGEGSGRATPAFIRARRSDGGWTSAELPVDSEGVFEMQLLLVSRATSVFGLEATAADGSLIPLNPGTVSIVHGSTVGDPPLSRTIGVALADDRVRPFFERGAALPAKRTFVQHTVSTVIPGREGSAIRIPIVQGEFDAAHLCRPVGTLEIRAEEIGAHLPAGSVVEITLTLDRAGHLAARAHLPQIGKTFEHVEHLVLPDAPPAKLEASLTSLRDRLAVLRAAAFAGRDTEAIRRLGGAERLLVDAARDLDAARGGDEDAAQKVRRNLSDLDAVVDEEEANRSWPEFVSETLGLLAAASQWVAAQGNDTERRMLGEAMAAVRSALDARAAESVRRHMRVVNQLACASYFRHPKAWSWELDRTAAEIDRASDRDEAERHLRRGRDAASKGDVDGVRAAVQALWRLLPPDVEANTRVYDSGLR